MRKHGFTKDEKVFPVYVKLEAEQEGEYKSYREVLRDTALEVAKKFGVSITNDEATRFASSVPTWDPFSDTVETMKELGRRGYKRVILSNIDRDILRNTISHSGIEVDGFITAEDVGSYKPAEGHWKRFFEEYSTSKSETLHVAQSIYHDITPTCRLGITNAWINRYDQTKPSDATPSFTFSDLKSLLSLLT